MGNRNSNKAKEYATFAGGAGGHGGGSGGGTGGAGGAGGSVTVNFPENKTVFGYLEPHVVFDAIYKSTKREKEHAVTCLPETRTKILDDIRSWVDNTMATRLCWLSGPAGTGKTTVAHTIAKEYDDRGQLAATFFFWRKTGDRDDIDRLIATLAWQIAKNIPSSEVEMEKALERLLAPLPKLSLEEQLSAMFIHGCVEYVNFTSRNIIVIDGLDECASQKGIRQLIGWLRNNKSPFRFLLTSRPEPHIKALFASGLGDGRIDVQSFSLTESKDDIRKYFIKELEEGWPNNSESRSAGRRSGHRNWTLANW